MMIAVASPGAAPVNPASAGGATAAPADWLTAFAATQSAGALPADAGSSSASDPEVAGSTEGPTVGPDILVLALPVAPIVIALPAPRASEARSGEADGNGVLSEAGSEDEVTGGAVGEKFVPPAILMAALVPAAAAARVVEPASDTPPSVGSGAMPGAPRFSLVQLPAGEGALLPGASAPTTMPATAHDADGRAVLPAARAPLAALPSSTNDAAATLAMPLLPVAIAAPTPAGPLPLPPAAAPLSVLPARQATVAASASARAEGRRAGLAEPAPAPTLDVVPSSPPVSEPVAMPGIAVPAASAAAPTPAAAPADVRPPLADPPPPPPIAVDAGTMVVATDRLGAVRVAIDAADGLAVALSVDRSAAAALLSAAVDRLDSALAAGGQRLDALSVDVRGGDGGRRPPPPPPAPTPPLPPAPTPAALARRDRYA